MNDVQVVTPGKVGKLKRMVGITDETEKLKFIRNRIMSVADELRTNNQPQLQDTIDMQEAGSDPQRLVMALLDVYQRADAAATSRSGELYTLSQRSNGQSQHIQKQKEEIERKQMEIDNLMLRYSRLDADKEQMEKSLRYETEQQKQHYQNQISNLNAEHEREVHALLDKHHTETRNLQETFTNEIRRKADDHSREVNDLQQAAADQEERLMKDIQELNVALVSRERFKPISDIVLQRQFSELIQDVDYLARLEWKTNRSEWKPDLLEQLSSNTRNLKRLILQDVFWSILFEYIFSTPFRVFGKEGRLLEDQWSEAFGTAEIPTNDIYSWPNADLSSERWRYEAMQKCQEVLGKPISEHHPGVDIKRGFLSTVKIINDKLAGALGQVTRLGDDIFQQLEELTMKAATMWVAFGTQRCRLIIAMNGSNLKTASSKISAARSRDGLMLVEKPELQRFGNAQGERLSSQEVVSGCRGEVVTLTMRLNGQISNN